MVQPFSLLELELKQQNPICFLHYMGVEFSPIILAHAYVKQQLQQQQQMPTLDQMFPSHCFSPFFVVCYQMSQTIISQRRLHLRFKQTLKNEYLVIFCLKTTLI